MSSRCRIRGGFALVALIGLAMAGCQKPIATVDDSDFDETPAPASTSTEPAAATSASPASGPSANEPAASDPPAGGEPATASVEATPSSEAALQVDPALPDYEPASGVSGNIKSVGSDSMNNLMTLWLEGFRKYYPSVQFEMEGKGSSTAPAALIAGTATFGPMSRPMKPAEIDSFEKKFGYKPTGIGTSIDMLAVFVNKDNPLEKLTLPQVDAIFSNARKLGYPHDIRTWSQVGLEGELANSPISLYGRNSASGTYGYFREKALGEGDYKDSVKEQPGSSSVIQAIARDKTAIGYSGIAYRTPDVRPIALAKEDQSEAIEAAPENAYTGKYPLSRPLIIYLNYKPGTQLDPLRHEFIRFIFSKPGQEAVVKDGYYPVNAALARQALEQVGIKPTF